jgi:uncharacterized membrane protein
VNGWASKPWGPFYLPLLMAGLSIFFDVARRIATRRTASESFRGALDVIGAAVVAFLFLLDVAALSVSLGHPLSMNRVVYAGCGLLFVVVGNVFGKLQRNAFAGIRTPWTLASDEVWLRTHRLGGKLWVGGGLVLCVSGLLGGGPLSLFAVLAVIAGVPAVYSYVIYRRLAR